MFYFKRQKHNPNKHELMPDDYPWTRQDGFSHGEEWETCSSEEEFQAIQDSFDLSDYFRAREEEKMFDQQNEQRLFGAELVGKFVDKIGARNLYLASKGVSINLQSLSQDNAALKMMVESGVLKTTLSYVSLIKAKYPDHSDIYDQASEEILNFLTERGFL